eukprot:CAMPEP_0182493134 /NCGR_PEP_ID=MMETSP1321-20130603/2149_1 /TAXON_ID=91990 /ORGANISM="Bolidomonas sp., Strain RCC1657" /LENGTH=211 /DNA_ID=CAMNT_0024695819 /DNA_START=251 /DNA_END=883 /DNA_ORIENTATION=-
MVVAGTAVIVTSTKKEGRVLRRQGMRVRMAFQDGKESWVELKDAELVLESTGGAGDPKTGKTGLPSGTDGTKDVKLPDNVEGKAQGGVEGKGDLKPPGGDVGSGETAPGTLDGAGDPKTADDVNGDEVHEEDSDVMPPKPPDEGRVRTGSQVEMAEGGIVVTMKLMPTTATKLINLTGFNMSKMKLEEITGLYLSGGLMTMEQFESFKKTS